MNKFNYRLFRLLPLFLLSALGSQAADPELTIATEADGWTLSAGDVTLLRYGYGAPGTPKSSVQELRTPSGINVLRDATVEHADHPHHRGLMFAVGVDGTDFWHEHGLQPSETAQVRMTDRPDGHGRQAFMEETVQWVVRNSGVVLLEENRQITACRLDRPSVTLLTWESRLTPANGVARILSGTSYFGLGIRMVETMDGGRRFSSASEEADHAPHDQHLIDAAWAAYLAHAAGQPVTVALFDHPDNPRHPARMFTMNSFGYLSATLNLEQQTLSIEPDQTLRLRYGVAVADGFLDRPAMEALYAQWLETTRTTD